MSIDERYVAGVDYEETEPLDYSVDGDEREPCGESGCICYGVGEEHADCVCGCDCPRCDDCMQKEENCQC